MQRPTSKWFKRPYNFLLIAAMIVLLLSAVRTSSIIDIHFHDTYFILPGRMGMWIASFILLFLWALYPHLVQVSTQSNNRMAGASFVAQPCVLAILVPWA